MSVAAGDDLTAPRLNPAAFQLQLAALYTLTGTATDLTLTNVTPGYASGALSFTVPEGGMTGLAVWAADYQLVTAGTFTAATVDLVIDGAIPTNCPTALWNPSNVAANARNTLGQSWPFALAAGSHSFGLRAAVSLTSGAIRLNPRHTALSILLHP